MWKLKDEVGCVRSEWGGERSLIIYGIRGKTKTNTKPTNMWPIPEFRPRAHAIRHRKFLFGRARHQIFAVYVRPHPPTNIKYHRVWHKYQFDKLVLYYHACSIQALFVRSEVYVLKSMTQKTNNEEEIKKVCKSNIRTVPDSVRDNRLAVCLVRKSKKSRPKHVQATLHRASFKATHRLIHDPRTPYMHAKISKRKKKKAIRFKKRKAESMLDANIMPRRKKEKEKKKKKPYWHKQ